MELDPRSVIFLAGFFSLPMAVALMLLRRIYPPTIAGIQQWAVGALLCFLATLLFGAFGRLPNLVTLVGGNMMALLGALLLYFGSQRFFGDPPAYRRWLLVLVVCVPALVWTVLESSPSIRLIFVNSLLTLIFVLHALHLLSHARGNIFTRLNAITMLVLTAIAVMRVVSILTGTGIRGVFDPAAAQILYVMGISMGLLLVTIGTVLMASERMRAEFEHLATHDTLTGTLIRRALIADCEREMDRCRRNGKTMALMMLDLDHFKAVNDTHGHQIGDQVLIDFVQRAFAQLRSVDKLGRYGGEEFVVLLPETTTQEASTVAQRILDMAPNTLGLPTCTVSIGIASSVPGDVGLDALLTRADAALYRAKANGRNRMELAAA